MSPPTYAQLAKVATAAADTLRVVTEERDTLQQKVAAYEKRDRAMKLASRMTEKGLASDPISKLASDLAKLTDQRLNVIEEAVELSASNPWDKVASLGSQNGNGAGLTAFEHVIMTGEMPQRRLRGEHKCPPVFRK